MERGDDLWRRAHDHANDFLRRFTDPWTRRHRDDLVQEAAIAAWQWADGVRDPRCFWSAVRTIARRVRYRALTVAARERRMCRELELRRGPASFDPRAHEVHVSIAGRRVPSQRVLRCVRRAIDRLQPVDRQLLRDFHEGFCCAELSARSNRSEQCVKTRLCRARRRVQSEVEECVRAASALDTQ